MAVKLTQSLKQTQNLMMTPQLQQAIKLLTLTHLEMTNVIAQEMVENPMLEEVGPDNSTDGKKNEDDYEVENLEMQNREAVAENFDEPTVVTKDDFDWQSYIETYNSPTYAQPSMATPDLDEMPNYENMVTQERSLPEHLEWQLRMENLTEEEWEVARRVIHNINDDGYLEIPFEEIITESGHNREDAFELLSMIQRLDPSGCGSRDLQDCLLAQAKSLEERSPLLELIIREHLKDLEHKNYEKISKDTGVSINHIKDAELILQTFHPRPGRLITPGEIHYVVPDIFVVKVGDEFVVQLNDEGVPRLKISQLYQSMLKKSSTESNKETKEYVQDKLRSALWLIKSIQNRQKTILKVANAIVRQQQQFFKKGPSFLKPMVLKDVAQEIGMHESTVSRVTNNKYMHTPIGVFELKYFFSSGLGGKDGGLDISGEVLKIKIKTFIENENPSRPLSDQKIAELLSREDIKVARRTVAKYREMMGLASSAKRKIKK